MAQEEINKTGDIKFTYKPLRVGKKVTRIEISVTQSEKKKIKPRGHTAPIPNYNDNNNDELKISDELMNKYFPKVNNNCTK